jgi:hypothetical protein
MAENPAVKQRGRPFQKGQSGNPAGKPKGAKHKATLAVEALLEGEADKLTRKAIDKALEGDGVALRLCLDRLCPPRRDRHVSFQMPPVTTAADAAKASAAILAGVADGLITPAEAAEVGKLIESHIKIIEASEFEARLAAVEERTKNDGPRSPEEN